MQYRKFGSLAWEASALGFGTMRLPGKKMLFGLIRKVDVPEAIKIIRHGIDHGINYIDTAYGYHGGKSEIIVGQALKDGYRDKVHLVTKLPMWKVKAPGDVHKYLAEQLKKLDTEHLDIYLCHGLNMGRLNTLKNVPVLKEMEEAKSSGLIKHIGFSFHDSWPVFKEIIDFYDKWEMAQIQYNYMDTEMQATTKGLEYAASKGIAVVIMEPLRGGKLAMPPPEVLALFDAAPVKRTPVDWALQFLWNRPEVSCVLSGMSSMKQVEENLVSAGNSGIGKLTKDEQALLEKVADIFRKMILVPCTACKYCMPCPSGVAIPEHFGLLNDLSRTGDRKRFEKQYKKLAMTKNDLNAARDNGMATLCTKCKKCMEACPQGIDIPAEIEKIHQILGNGHPLDEYYK
nr:aldo/keto reductase [Candidatus Sigynarchaeota archaeon]